jgi:purine-binding chemotaxis protein CheW
MKMAEAMDQDKDVNERQLVTFHLGREEFGADIMNVREIVRLGEITKIPQAPPYVEGVSNLRGTILPIIDGRKRFGLESRANDESTRVLVIDVQGSITGMIVDRVAEVLRVSEADIEPLPKVLTGGVDPRFIDGIVKLEDGHRIIMALSMDTVLTIEKYVTEEIAGQTKAIDNRIDRTAEAAEIDEDHLVTFSLDGEEYAFDIMRVKEIIRVPEITRVPNTFNYVEGVVSIRNQLLPIVNLRTFLGLSDFTLNDQARVIIIDTGAVTAGFLVDRVAEVIRVSRALIEPPPMIYAGQDGDRIRGVAKLDNGKRLLMALNAENLLPADAFREVLGAVGDQAADEADVKHAEEGVIDEEQLVTFLLDKEEYAIQISHVQEINRMTEITKMPGAPALVEGLVNLRGSIIPALNLRRRFGLPDREHDDRTRIIIVDLDSKKTGIVVDAVSEVLRFERSLIEATPEVVSGSMEGEYISGVGKLDEGKRMVLILDLHKIICFDVVTPEGNNQDNKQTKTRRKRA